MSIIVSCFTCEQALAEPDAFFCFVELLSGFRDNFCKQLDNSVVGIRSTITTLSQLLRRHDEELWRHLEVVTKVSYTKSSSSRWYQHVVTGTCVSSLTHAFLASQVNPQFYAFRWITLLLTQEFQFRDCLSLWDTLLGDPEGPQVREPRDLWSYAMRLLQKHAGPGLNPSVRRAGYVVAGLLRDANSCPEKALGWRFHCESQASPELPTHKHRPHPTHC